MDYIGTAKSRNYLVSIWFSFDGDILLETVGDIWISTPDLLFDLEITEFWDWTQIYFLKWKKIFPRKSCHSALSQEINRKLHYIAKKISYY